MMYNVYQTTSKCKILIAQFEELVEAASFCCDYGWEIEDENGFCWELEIEEE